LPLTLADTYNYRAEDIVVLKDLPEFPEQSKPTRVNMVRYIRFNPSAIRIEIQQIRELKALVSGAEPGDKFTFFCVSPSSRVLPTLNSDEYRLWTFRPAGCHK